MLFSHLKRILRLGRLRLRGSCGAKDEFLLAATAQNLQRRAKLRPASARRGVMAGSPGPRLGTRPTIAVPLGLNNATAISLNRRVFQRYWPEADPKGRLLVFTAKAPVEQVTDENLSTGCRT